MKNRILAALLALLCLLPCLSGCRTRKDTPGAVDTDAPDRTITDTSDPVGSIWFDSYEDYFAFFTKGPLQDSDLWSVSEDYWQAVRDYVDRVAEGQEPLVIPYYRDAPVTLRQEAGFGGIVFSPSELYKEPWTWFYCPLESKGGLPRIRLSVLSPEWQAASEGRSCSAFLTTVWPDAPNVHNIGENPNYQAAYEKEIFVDHKTVAALILEATDGEIYIEFVTDGVLVSAVAPIDMDTEVWLQELSFKKINPTAEPV